MVATSPICQNDKCNKCDDIKLFTPEVPTANYGAIPQGADFYRVGFTIQRLASKSFVNFFLAVLCLVYVVVNVACFIMNCLPRSFRHTHCVVFHLLEFWATFFFSVVSLSSFIFARKPLKSIHDNPTFLKILLFANIVFSGVPAILVTIDLKTFEVFSHEIEYVVSILQALMDIIVFNLISKQNFVFMQVIFLGMAFLQFATYNLCANGEQISHFFEFIFEICTATIMFCFCVDNKFALDQVLCRIFHGSAHCVEHCDLLL